MKKKDDEDDDILRQSPDHVSATSEIHDTPSMADMLQSLLSEEDIIGETSWLTGRVMDVVLFRLARHYPSVFFLPTDFIPLLNTSSSNASSKCLGKRRLNDKMINSTRDILGRNVLKTGTIVFVLNIGKIHWNLFRLQHAPSWELQLFEPMGRPDSRRSSVGISCRVIPRSVVNWLDVCFPRKGSWRSRTVSAITHRHQFSGYDCGVACLLYARKCGQGQDRNTINERTSQVEITRFRATLQAQFQIPHEQQLLV